MVLDVTKENVYILWGENRDERLYFNDLEKLDSKELAMLLAHLDAVKQAYKEEKAIIQAQIQAEDFSNATKAQLIYKLHGLKSRTEVYTRFSTQSYAIRHIREEQAKADDRRARKREYESRKRERERLLPEHQITYDSIADRAESIRNTILRDKLRQLLGNDAYKRASDAAHAQAIRETLEWMNGQDDIPDTVRERYHKHSGKRLRRHARNEAEASETHEIQAVTAL